MYLQKDFKKTSKGMTLKLKKKRSYGKVAKLLKLYILTYYNIDKINLYIVCFVKHFIGRDASKCLQII